MKTNIPRADREAEAPLDAHPTDQLARSIAEEFDDIANVDIYRRLCRAYSEAVIRKAHNAALSVPPDKVKRSRLALFIFLVKKYAGKAE